MGIVKAVNISKKKGTIKHAQPEITLVEDFGIQDDAHAGNWHRQVSLLDQASVDKMTDKGVEGLEPGMFAENITTDGINLYDLPVGTHLQVGPSLLEVTQIGKECHKHCQIYHQIGMCIMPTEGIFTRVLQGGVVRAGDEISVVLTVRAAILTISDKGYAGTREDRSGPALVEALKNRAAIVDEEVLPDDFDKIKAKLIALADSNAVDVIFTTGGTGFAPRDITPEATMAVIDRQVPGIPEAMRAASAKITDRAMLSRATAGIRKQTMIINLPGSPKAAVENLEVFLPVMAHAIETLRGETYECGSG